MDGPGSRWVEWVGEAFSSQSAVHRTWGGGVVNASASGKSFRRGSGNTEGQAELVTRETGEPDQEGTGRRLEEDRRGGSMNQQGSAAAETLRTAGSFSQWDTLR